MKESFLRLEHFTSGLAMAGACAMLVVASTLGMFQIVTRFVLEQPAEWSEILIRLALIWMVFLGIPAAFRHGAMVSVDVLYRWSPRGLRRGGAPPLPRRVEAPRLPARDPGVHTFGVDARISWFTLHTRWMLRAFGAEASNGVASAVSSTAFRAAASVSPLTT